MINKINTPTADEFIQSRFSSVPYEIDDITQLMVDFAKMHVKAALLAALDNSPHGSSTDIPTYEEMSDAILNSYPEDLIQP